MATTVVGYVRKKVNGNGQVTGWAAYVGEPGAARYLTDFNTAREAITAVEKQIRASHFRWHRREPGYYEAVMR